MFSRSLNRELNRKRIFKVSSLKTFYLALVPEQPMTPFSSSKFDCAVQSRDVRENRALKQPEKLRPSPLICLDGNDYFEPCPQGFLVQFSRWRRV